MDEIKRTPCYGDVEKVRVILFRQSGKYYTEEEWRVPTMDECLSNYYFERGDVFYPGVMRYSPDFRRIDRGPVLVESQEPWGHPAILMRDDRG